MAKENAEYAGFWIRVGATLIDTILLLMVTIPLLLALYGGAYWNAAETSLVAGTADFLITWVAPAVAAIAFWIYRQATPGKMMLGLRVVDARTGAPLRLPQGHHPLYRLLPRDHSAGRWHPLGCIRRAQAGLARQDGRHRGHADVQADRAGLSTLSLVTARGQG